MDDRTDPALESLCDWLEGRTEEEIRARHGLTAAELGVLRARLARVVREGVEEAAAPRARRAPGRLAVVALSLTLGLWAATRVYAQASCESVLPSPLHTMCGGARASASDVNENFSTLVGWIEAKVGSVDSGAITARDPATFESTVLVRGASVMESGAVIAGAAEMRGDAVVHGSTEMQGSVTMNGGLTVAGTATLQVPVLGSYTSSGGANNTETYRLTSAPFTCDASTRGRVYVARPSAQSDQDSLCFCGHVGGEYEHYCLNP